MPITRCRRLLFALASLAAPLAARACPLALPELELEVAGQRLTAELAATPRAQNCGLARRDTLPPGRGMLFVFPAPVTMPFWMKDTRIPLSIAFLDGDGRILAVADMAPMDTRNIYRPDRPYRYALEVNQGWFAEHGVAVGDRVQFSLPAGPPPG